MAKIKAITNRDKELLSQLARTGIITQEQTQRHLGYAKDGKRLNNLSKSRFLKVERVEVNGTYQNAYKLDTEGIKYVRNNISEIDGFYKMASVKHDYALTELYYNQYYDYRDTWVTETDYKENGQYGAPDGSVVIDGTVTVIEVITRNYTDEQVESKEVYANSNGMEMNKHYV